ncbi:MAG: ABC transporter ATP-binding protein [Magnetococcales bacterium]|nr:ABC transporter ATP-binding protein [Magnetococcales bacterium]
MRPATKSRSVPPSDQPAFISLNAIEINQVSKHFGGLTVLDRVTLPVQNGSLFGLAGGNGAGKTTLIKTLLDLCRPDSGEIRIRGTGSTAVAARNTIAYLPERFLPPGHLSGQEFLSLLLRLHGVKPVLREMEDQVASLDMNPAALKKPIRSLSKGMTQKLGLAGCLMSGKTIWLLDEPTSGLDPLARALLKQQLRRSQQQGVTLFLNTHLLADVDDLCDAMAILHQGRLLFAGSPTDCRERFGGDSLETAYLRAVAPERLTDGRHQDYS